ncbi:MAG: hypothetical protein HC809_04310 [Gammaproteobacteria bacterium]|nr:hypothetical protein [Gammaproteobacteria bacterium]
MTELTRLSGVTAVAEDVIGALECDGGVIIEDFLAQETLDGLRSDLLPLLEQQPVGRDSFAGERTRRLSAPCCANSPLRSNRNTCAVSADGEALSLQAT